MLLPRLEQHMVSTWSAECASIVIELVIANTFMPFFLSITNYISCFEVKLQLQITVFKKLRSLFQLLVQSCST